MAKLGVQLAGIAVFINFFPVGSLAQVDSNRLSPTSESLHKKRLYSVIAAEGFLYSGAMIGLGRIWYTDYPRSDFHFFNDAAEWQQMDKAGHFMAAFYLNNMETAAYRWCGVEEKKALWLGGTLGSLFMMSIEVFDGYSAGWGASVWDLFANLGGRAFSIGEDLLWKEQRIKLKFSFHQTKFARYRPDLLGTSPVENLLKDYNGQSYWVSANIGSFLGNDSNFPPWLNIALGYGANGMIGGDSNPDVVDGIAVPEFTRYRQYYLSFDADLSKIRTRSTWLKSLFGAFGFVKIPFSSIEYNHVDGVIFHPVYF